MKKFLVLLLTGSLIFANSAFAARFGGGKNSGMQRSTPPSSYSNTNVNRPVSPQENNTNSNINMQQQQPRSGIGAGTAAVLGAAAGAAGGYMLGKNSNSTANESAMVTSEERSSIPWGTIAILVIILALGLIFFRKKAHPRLTPGNPVNNYAPNNQNNFNMPTINRNKTTQNRQASNQTGTSTPTQEQLTKMPDGIETVYFLRQAKGMFLHIQSMNNSDNLTEIQKYMTPELFETTKNDIATNSVIADFPTLDCQLVQCEAIKGGQSADGLAIEPQLVASVKFFGTINEDPQQPSKPFSEIWNFVKSARTNNKWLIAGIQQEALAN